MKKQNNTIPTLWDVSQILSQIGSKDWESREDFLIMMTHREKVGRLAYLLNLLFERGDNVTTVTPIYVQTALVSFGKACLQFSLDQFQLSEAEVQNLIQTYRPSVTSLPLLSSENPCSQRQCELLLHYFGQKTNGRLVGDYLRDSFLENVQGDSQSPDQ